MRASCGWLAGTEKEREREEEEVVMEVVVLEEMEKKEEEEEEREEEDCVAFIRFLWSHGSRMLDEDIGYVCPI